MTKSLRLFVALVAAILIATMFATSANAERSDRSSKGQATADYWTAERRANAKPRDIVVGDAIAQKGKPGGGGGTVVGASWPDGSPDRVERSVAKVFFSMGGQNWVCSASLVTPNGTAHSVALTAGHCTWDDAAGSATNFMVIPNYDAFTASQCTNGVNCWTASSLHPAASWLEDGDDYAHDYAFAQFDRSLTTTVGLDAEVPIATGIAPPTSVHAFGYPAAQKYSGHDLTYCAGPTSVLAGSSYAGTVKIACDMTGGSSGGPWYRDFNDVKGQPVRRAVSLNSFGLRGYNGYMFGPVFDSQATAALSAAS